MNVADELLEMLPVIGTMTENDLKCCIEKSLENACWSKFAIATTDRLLICSVNVGASNEKKKDAKTDLNCFIA